jgi:signal transduction histidine kinase
MPVAKVPALSTSLPTVGIAAALVVIVVTGLVAIASISDFQQRIERIGHTNAVIGRIAELSALMTEAQAATRGFVVTGNERFAHPFDIASTLLPERLAQLDQMVSDNPQQKQALTLLAATMQKTMAFNRTLLNLRRTSVDAAAASALVASEEGEQMMQSLRAQAAQMAQTEQQLLVTRSTDADAGARHARLLIIFGSLLGIATSASVFFLLRIENRRRRTADRALTSTSVALKQHADRLEASNQELESFSYSISHDLRIPLRAVSGYAHMLEEDYADKIDDEGKRLLSVIRDNSRRMGELIDDLLAFSRLGRQSIQAVEVDMRALVDRAIEQIKRKDEYANARIEIGDLPPAWGDRALLQQVWLNLISNALKYSGTRDHPEITISGAAADGETRYTVSDNGVGFDMQYYGKLFGVFQRLAISHRIVTRHGGRISGDSVLDHGASFSFALPTGAGHE